MKVSRKSWHYKVLLDQHKAKVRNDNTSLCNYFWMVVSGVLCNIAAGLLITILVVCVLFLIGLPILNAFMYYTDINFIQLDPKIVNFCITFTAAVSSVYIGSFIFRSIKKLFGYIRYKFWGFNRKMESENNSLLYNYLRAKKNKICPMIELE